MMAIFHKSTVEEMEQKEELETAPEYMPPPIPERRKFLGLFKVNKPYFLAKILLPNKQIIQKNVWIKPEMTFKYKSHAYSISQEDIRLEKVGKKWLPVCYYWLEYPTPIKFKPTQDQGSLMTFTSQDYKEALDSKVFQELNKLDSPIFDALILICVVVSALGVILLNLKQFGVIK